MTTLTDTQPRRQLPIDDTGGCHCVLCDRAWPGQPAPIRHRFVMSDVAEEIICCCDADHHAATWHQFTCANHNGVIAVGMVCGPCITDPGWGAAIQVALRRAYTAAQRTN